MQLHLLLIFTEEIRQTGTIHKLYWSCTVPVFCQKTNSGLNEQLLKSVQSMFWVIRKSKHFFFFWYCNKNIFDFQSIWNFVSTTNNFQINTARQEYLPAHIYLFFNLFDILAFSFFFILIIILLLWSNKFR